MKAKLQATWKHLALAGVIALALVLGIWRSVGGDPDQVANDVQVQRGEYASDKPNPDAQMMIEHSQRR